MKKTALALAAVLALTGGALACETTHGKYAPTSAACMHKATKLDCAATGSIPKHGLVADQNATASKQPRLGMEMDPWLLPNTF